MTVAHGRVPRWLALDPRISPQEKTVFLVLAVYAGADGECNISATTLGKHVGCDERTARRYLVALEEKGCITIIRRFGQTNRYRLHSERITPDNTVRGTPDTAARGTPDTGVPPDTAARGTPDTGARQPSKEEDPERVREGQPPDFGSDPGGDGGDGDLLENGFSCNNGNIPPPLLEEWRKWTGLNMPEPFRYTIRLLMRPRGDAVGAWVNGQVYNGFGPEDIRAGIEAMQMKAHHSPASLVKHVAGLMKDIPRTKSAKVNHESTTDAPAFAAELDRRIRNRKGRDDLSDPPS